MLYCPRCKAKYEKGTQRFCTNEGVRLLPLQSEGKPGDEQTGVFSRILGKPSDEPEKFAGETKQSASGTGRQPGEKKFFSELEIDEIAFELEDDDPDVRKVGSPRAEQPSRGSFEPIPIARLIDPIKIPEKRTEADLEIPDGPVKLRSRGEPLEREQSPPGDLELDLGQVSEPDQTADAFAPPRQSAAFNDLEVELESGENDEDLLGEINLDLPGPDVPSDDTGDIELEIGGGDAATAELPGDLPIELNLEHTPETETAPLALPEIELDLDGITIPDADEPRVETAEPKKAPRMIKADEIDEGFRSAPDVTLEQYSDERDSEITTTWYLPIIAALLILAIGVVGLIYLVKPKRSAEIPATNAEVKPQNTAGIENFPDNQTPEAPIQKPAFTSPQMTDQPPPPRQVKQPPNTVFFRNKDERKPGSLPAKEFLGFSIYFPKDWIVNKSEGNFLDVSKSAPDGIPIEQLLVSRYESRGTFEDDREIFDQLVQTSNNDLKKILANYQVISEGEIEIQNGRWKAYEVKFQGLVSTRKLILWGRRLWIPVQRKGMKSGFIITMIATSLADNIDSVEDIGVTGDLATILNTFEPELK